MVKKDIPKNITLNLGNMAGSGKKKRGRPRKTAPKPKEVIIKEVLPHQKFSRKANKALDQLLEANREKEKAEAEKGLRELARMRGAGDKAEDPTAKYRIPRQTGNTPPIDYEARRRA